MKPIYYFLIVSSIILCNCKSQHYIHFVPYSQLKFDKTELSDIKVYEKRLDIPSRYTEIGVLKIEGEHPKSEILNEAAKRGADAIIYEANNVVLIHLAKTEGDEKGEDIY